MKKVGLGLLFVVAVILFGKPVLAQQAVTTDEIIQSLKPKARTTRGLIPHLSSEDAAFIDKLKRTKRGLTVEERTQLSNIVSSVALPSIDLEVTFALNSTNLARTAVQTLQKLGAALSSKELSDKSFLIAGYTDARGTREYNQRLSEERARTVKSFLSENFQVSPARLLAVGYGQEQLKNPNDPLADENRRVKIINLEGN